MRFWRTTNASPNRCEAVPDPYLYEDAPVLRNKLDIRDDKTLDLVEAEQSRQSMMILYKKGFDDFSPAGLCEIHRFLFKNVYEWAGKYRIINIEKRERLLAGRSVWYSNDEDIPRDLDLVFQEIGEVQWAALSREQFVHALTRYFPKIWQVHPFREGNTRTVVMLMTFFVEHYGYYMDQDLMAASAGYVRDSFVMACLDQFSEYEHLEKILLDAVCDEPTDYDATSLEGSEQEPQQSEKYKKYQREEYKPQPHYRRED